MQKKETYPIFNLIFYTVLIGSAYGIYSTYTARNINQPAKVVQVSSAPKQSATPAEKLSFEDKIAIKVATDSIDQAMVAFRSKDYSIACVHFGVASAAVLSTKRQDDYVKMRDLEKTACKLAGISS